MRYIVDASVALKWVMNETDAPIALRIRNQFRQSIHELIAPDVFVLETAHGLSKAERKAIVPDCEILWLELMADCPEIFPSFPYVKRAIQIARKARIAVYDCVYIALAEHEHCGFLTADERLVRNLQPDFPFITSLATLA
jgi:predicted nucleic acid-binding protein